MGNQQQSRPYSLSGFLLLSSTVRCVCPATRSVHLRRAGALELLLQLSRYVLPELKALAVEVRPPPGDVRELSMAELACLLAETSEGKLSPSDVRRLSVVELERMALGCERLPAPSASAVAD